jgi:endoglucanase
MTLIAKYLAGLLCLIGAQSCMPPEIARYDSGGIVRMDPKEKVIYLVFTGHEFADGCDTIGATLHKHGVRASFFFTGDFYRTEAFAPMIAHLRADGHYCGGHSDKHLLYAPWENRDSLLVSREAFLSDLRSNYGAMAAFGIRPGDAPYFLPPYEWYNRQISEWTREEGLQLVNFTPGTYSNADWSYPALGARYLSSDTIYARILAYEKRDSNGLNGFLLLMHCGTDPRRPDKFYYKLDRLIEELVRRGYRFRPLSQK